MSNAFERYKTLVRQVEAFNTSFKAAEARLTAGVGTTVDYVLAKSNLDRANINLIAAKYEFVLRKKILDYYQNVAVIR
jgi:outer membrane protein